MKKLNKGLSLVLVLAMVLSLFSVSAFATNAQGKTYTDVDVAEITPEGNEAIEVLTGLGVLEGNSTDAVTTFEPAGDFTRAQAAKIISYLVAGTEVVDALSDKASGFSDDDAWSGKYVRFASERGIIAGYGNGKFGPSDTLTKAQWLKMLLCAIGYDPVACGLVGDYWDVNAIELAKTIGLVRDGEVALDFNREWAAIYAYRAIRIPLKPVAYVVTTATGAKAYIADLSGVSLNNKNFHIDFDRDYVFGAFHRPAGYNIYKTDGTWIANVKDWILEATYDDEKPEIPEGAEIYVDGVEAGAFPATANGTRTEVYTLGNGNTAVIVLTDWFDVDEDGVAYIYNEDLSRTAFAGTVENKAVAESENIRIDGVTAKGEIIAEGNVTFTYSLNEDILPVSAQDINKRTFTIYYDHAGHAIHMEQVRFETETVYVLGIRARANYGVDDDNLFVPTASALAQAQVINLETGKVEVVNIKTTKYLGAYYYADVNGEHSGLQVRSTNISAWIDGWMGNIEVPENQNWVPLVQDSDHSNNIGFYEITWVDGEVVFTEQLETVAFSTSKGDPIITFIDPDDDETIEVHTDSETTITNITYYADGSADVKVETITGYKNFVDHNYNNAIVDVEIPDGAGYPFAHAAINVEFAFKDRTTGMYIGKNLAGGTDGLHNTTDDTDIYYFVVDDQIIGRYANNYFIDGYYSDYDGAQDKDTLEALEPGTLVSFVDYADVWTVYDVEKIGIASESDYVVTDTHQGDFFIIWAYEASGDQVPGTRTVVHPEDYIIVDEDGFTTELNVGDTVTFYKEGYIVNHGQEEAP